MRVRLPIPDAWQDFEKLCQQLWKEIWCDVNATNNGRTGQPQNGVDVYGKPIYTVNWAGVQCKDKDCQLGSVLKISEIDAECEKAKKFQPAISNFSFATTAARDVKVQEYARLLNTHKKYPFDVHVWAWEDIAAEITARPTLLKNFYNDLPNYTDLNSDLTTVIAVTAPKDQFKAFFSRPALAESLGAIAKEAISQISYELSDNAFLHGKAKHVSLSFVGNVFSIEDDGIEFNPLEQLDATKASARSHLGSLVFSRFQADFRNEISITYSRIEKGGVWKNKLSLELSKEAQWRPSPEVFDLQVDLGEIFSRAVAKRYAQSLIIPVGVLEVVLVVGSGLNYSGVFGFLLDVRERLPENIKLTVSHARGDFIGNLDFLLSKHNIQLASR